ncbi:CHAT domain-containing protein [Streptomyces sp. NPDC058000]|uniref:CHAT domain-containing protein n=1 Tax=Streptomyces sp. NPDC058000 TaxID=3346299 RepID=UPI0036E9AB58
MVELADHTQLAYLSACNTANRGAPQLLDEVIHLTNAFQLAGFPHVVGPLWPISDHLAVEIVESFYAHLTTGPRGRLGALPPRWRVDEAHGPARMSLQPYWHC